MPYQWDPYDYDSDVTTQTDPNQEDEEAKRRRDAVLAPDELEQPGEGAVKTDNANTTTHLNMPWDSSRSVTNLMMPWSSAPSAQAMQAPTLGPAMQKYSDLAGQAPVRSDPKYKPGFWRNLGATLAGVSTMNPAQGIAIANYIKAGPYRQAYREWENKLEGARVGALTEEKGIEEQTGRMRAEAALQSAAARQRAAEADEERRRYQESLPRRWVPTTKEEALQLVGAQHPVQPRRLSETEAEQQWFKDDPVNFQKYMALKHKQGRTVDEEKQLIEYKAKMNAKYHVFAPKIPKQPTVRDTALAEQMAIGEVLKTNPNYSKYASRPRVSGWGGLMGQEDTTKPYSIATMPDTPEGRNEYKLFLDAVETAKQRILGQTQQYTLSQTPDDEDEDQQ